ncbi:hypothetical protein M3Y95_00315900 [Aphelenchoides besseyi]|nr:hypothetical protein M3Y95_00315900 [Aphelenchoides besseyi]
MISFKFFLFIFATAVASVFFILSDTFVSHNSQDFEQILATEEPQFNLLNSKTTPPPIAEECRLPKLDPWDPSIKMFLDAHKNPRSNCKVRFVRRSFVKSGGVLVVNQTDGHLKDGEKCFFRCLFPVDDWNLRFGSWIHINSTAKPQCDVFDVQCSVAGITTYKFLHAQIFEQPPLKVKPLPNTPDVHMIVLDSVSMSQFFRSMPMTLHFLRTEMDAVIFPYANKVGLNSRPNAYGFMIGERAEALPPNPWGRANPHGRSTELCKKALDTENVIMLDYKKQGFRTMMNEDWVQADTSINAIGIFNWPTCTGFKKPPADHFMKPYTIRIEGDKRYKDKELDKMIFQRSCIERHDYILDVLEDYVGKYPNEPKFSLSWMTQIAHDDWNGLYHVDEQFRDFFARIKSKLRNSFVIFQADHGGRTGSVRQTMIGEIEDNNPFLALILPEHLRGKSEIMAQLYRNSQQLTTHFDLYATLVEIANNGAQWNNKTDFANTTYEHPNRTFIGSSLFHPLKQPRTCEKLMIPFHCELSAKSHQSTALAVCLCQHDHKLIKNESIALRVAELAVTKMNDAVRRSEYKDKCSELTVDRNQTATLDIQEFNPQGERRIFRVNYRVEPSGGFYDAFAEMTNEKVKLISNKFPRHDRYAKDAACIPENFIRNYCFCSKAH